MSTAFDSRLLSLASEQVDDLERTRTANANRLRQLTRSAVDKDGEERGFGYSSDDPEVAGFASVVEGLEAMEAQAVKNLQKALRQHPLGPWVKKTVGVGEKQGARLLASIGGDPYIRPEIELEDGTIEPSRPRTIGELWAYVGYSVIEGHAQKRTKGKRSNWNEEARKRCYLIAEACLKAKRTSPYGPIYDAAREKYADAVHPHDCPRCGPAGKPAKAGSPLSLAHQHARALRLVSKEVLRDLWIESKRLHEAKAAPAKRAA